MSRYTKNIYTDLAIEAKELIEESDANHFENVPGVSMKTYANESGNIKLTWVRILDAAGEQELGKPIGNYVTIEAPEIKENSIEVQEEVIRYLAEQLQRLIKLPEDATVLVVGLGNWNVTPDSLGPKVVSQTLVTRHIIEEVPSEIDDSVRPVSALSPGVMGITGIETLEIVRGVVDRVKPQLVIAIDSLAARKTSRINATIQITDTGVAPGGGMGNTRKILNQYTLGVPVIAIGVPTVVDAATLVNDTMNKILEDMIRATEEGKAFYEMLTELEDEEKYSLIVELLDPYTENMFVTPKEVDAVMDKLAKIIANAINIALQPGIRMEDINRYTS